MQENCLRDATQEQNGAIIICKTLLLQLGSFSCSLLLPPRIEVGRGARYMEHPDDAECCGVWFEHICYVTYSGYAARFPERFPGLLLKPPWQFWELPETVQRRLEPWMQIPYPSRYECTDFEQGTGAQGEEGCFPASERSQDHAPPPTGLVCNGLQYVEGGRNSVRHNLGACRTRFSVALEY